MALPRDNTYAVNRKRMNPVTAESEPEVKKAAKPKAKRSRKSASKND